MRTVLDPTRTPVLFHCTAGKDRTGWAATILLLAAGVDEAGALDEFLAVNPAVRETFAPLLQQLAAAGGDPELLRPMLEVRAEYLQAALDTMRERFGSFDGYLRDGLGPRRRGGRGAPQDAAHERVTSGPPLDRSGGPICPMLPTHPAAPTMGRSHLPRRSVV